MRHELLLGAGYRIGRKATLRALGDMLAEQERAMAELQAEFGRETGELRALLDQASRKLAYLQRLDAAMRETPLPGLH